MRYLLFAPLLLMIFVSAGHGCEIPPVDLAPQFLAGKTADEAAEPGLLPPCFHVARLRGAEAVAITGSGGPGAVAWQAGWRWVVRPTDRQDWPITGGSIAFPGGAPDLFLSVTGQGSGQFGYLLHGRPAAGGRLALTPVTEITGRAEFDFLRHDLVLFTHSGGPDGPLAWTGNAWLPANDQELLRWDGRKFSRVARRTMPGPGLTANLFLGALAAGDLEAAARWASSPAVAAQALRVLGLETAAPGAPGSMVAWADAEDPALAAQVRQADKFAWDALPLAAQSDPWTRYTFPINRGRDRAELHMTRTPAGWVVTRVTKQKAPGRLTAPGASAYVLAEGQTAPAAPVAAAMAATKATR